MRRDLAMSGSSADQPRVAAMQAVVQFFAVTICGTILTAVAALFAYANAPNPDSHDSLFVMAMAVGAVVSAITGAFVARRALRTDSAETGTGAAYSLLQKYRRADTRPGADAGAGQYRIGERYLRELLGRRGA